MTNALDRRTQIALAALFLILQDRTWSPAEMALAFRLAANLAGLDEPLRPPAPPEELSEEFGLPLEDTKAARSDADLRAAFLRTHRRPPDLHEADAIQRRGQELAEWPLFRIETAARRLGLSAGKIEEVRSEIHRLELLPDAPGRDRLVRVRFLEETDYEGRTYEAGEEGLAPRDKKIPPTGANRIDPDPFTPVLTLRFLRGVSYGSSDFGPGQPGGELAAVDRKTADRFLKEGRAVWIPEEPTTKKGKAVAR